MKKLLLSLAALVVLATACEKKQSESVKDNPLVAGSTLEQGAPEFDKIYNRHYMPAFKAGMEQQREEIESIVNSSEAPSFENTILAYERSGAVLRRTSNVFFALANANSSDSILAIEQEVTPLLAEHQNFISLNDKLFERIRVVYENSYETLEGEDKKLLKEIYDGFVREGAALEADKKAELEKINTRLASLQQEFESKVTKGTNAAGVWVATAEELSGLSDAQLKQAEADAQAAGGKEKYFLVVSNTTQQPLLASLDNREVRRKLFEASVSRTSPDSGFNTEPIALEIIRLRAKKAELLGFRTFADWRLQDAMAKEPQNVYTFFQDLIIPYIPKINAETAEIEAYARKTEGADFSLEPYDRFYFSAKMKREKFAFDEAEVRQYFELNNVLNNGVFYAANAIFGITFEERNDLPVYHPDVKVYNVKDADGTLLAIFYTDFFRRDSKRGGAWMDAFAKQSSYFGQLPIIYNVCNYAKPAEGQPALLSIDDVETMFHEFGHAIHGMLSNCKYNTLSGTAVSRDFVEYPSQFNEYFITVDAVFDNFAKHYATGEPMPAELKKKVRESENFHSAYSLGENMSAVLVDMGWHILSSESAEKITSIKEKEDEILSNLKLYNKQVPPRYHSLYFRHVFGGGYAAGYYSYLWSEVLAVNTGDLFSANGGLSRELGQKYRDLIVSIGNTKDLEKQFTELTGLEAPDSKALLRAKGL
ncbi:M3 family metallopeptidase [Porphyromonas canoris]|uniref:Dipeptidyl carboxypeptidase II n=1 Tax=Porphyromonas canoris TaxID=36875 RepID=A0ABR4XJA5_9PORP|nr:M3 family metallopeptidase [Porphyromonas canoris]KGN91767.1 dipeptidyl carboxypeptidase II [Porphyromonas canoris]